MFSQATLHSPTSLCVVPSPLPPASFLANPENSSWQDRTQQARPFGVVVLTYFSTGIHVACEFPSSLLRLSGIYKNAPLFIAQINIHAGQCIISLQKLGLFFFPVMYCEN